MGKHERNEAIRRLSPPMRNKAMERKLASGNTIDVSAYLQSDGTYLLPSDMEIDGKDFCDASDEVWIWSVGRSKSQPGEIRAARDSRYYQNDDWICLWLR